MTPAPSHVAIALRALVLTLASACALAAVAGQGGRWSDRLDALNHLTPVWLLGGLIAVALWLVLGRPGRVIPVLGAIAALVSFLNMAPELIAAATTPARASGQTLKIVQFNVWQRNTDPQATALWLIAQDADVVVVEEATWPIYHPLKALYPYRSTCRVEVFCSTMILSKTAPIAQGGLGDSDPPMAATWATYQLHGQPVTVIAAHLEWPWPPGPQQAQIRSLSDLVGHFPRDSTIVAGDFNLTPWSFVLRRQDRSFGLQRRTHALFSWPAPALGSRGPSAPVPLMAIDQVYAGSSWKTVSVRRGPRLGSDHYPVVATLAR
jgi:endonuclease/exonuclease/phosphatase (EEP) superfamily protein YafD